MSSSESDHSFANRPAEGTSDRSSEHSGGTPSVPVPTRGDQRLYVPQQDLWEARVKPNSIREYCYYQAPGDDHFHLLMVGEIYLARGHEKCCLNCAHRLGIVTTERLHWQHPSRNLSAPKY